MKGDGMRVRVEAPTAGWQPLVGFLLILFILACLAAMIIIVA